METAKSIRYGGLLVEAADCDYTSFKHLGLLCPICSKPVFLRSGSERSPHQRKTKNGAMVEVKGSLIKTYFAHHPDVYGIQVEECELRSKQLTYIQRDYMAAKARGQRLKTLQSHCWKILKTSVKLIDVDKCIFLMRDLWDRATVQYGQPKASLRHYQLLIERLCDQFSQASQLAHTKSTLDEGIEKWYDQSLDQALVPSVYQEFFEGWRATLDRKMQGAIVTEVLDFVCQKRQRPILQALVENSLYCMIMANVVGFISGKGHTEKIIQRLNQLAPDQHEMLDAVIANAMLECTKIISRMDGKMFEDAFYFIRDDVTQAIVFTDWAGQFEKLHNKELTKFTK